MRPSCTYTNLDTSVIWYSLLLLGYKPVQHVTVLNTVGNCNTHPRYTLTHIFWNIFLCFWVFLGSWDSLNLTWAWMGEGENHSPILTWWTSSQKGSPIHLYGRGRNETPVLRFSEVYSESFPPFPHSFAWTPQKPHLSSPAGNKLHSSCYRPETLLILHHSCRSWSFTIQV